MNLYVVLGFFSGVPALVYEVVWTREVALLAGGQVEAISTVLVTFFGGLAVGSRVFGAVCDRTASPLRLYAALEAGAGALALLSPALLRGLGAGPLAGAAGITQLTFAAALLFPVTFLLGGTLPALLRSAAGDASQAAGAAGRIIGANTAGAVAGVVAAAALVPALGLRITVSGAALTAIALGATAFAVSRQSARSRVRSPVATTGMRTTPTASPAFVLAAATVAGVATLAFEVLAARAATLRLGSSLYAWALVLGLFLMGLAIGNFQVARRAGGTRDPASDLGWIESAAALMLVLGTAWGIPSVLAPATGPTTRALLEFAGWILPPALLMGAAFPLFVRLAVRDANRVGTAFGAVSAANTAGGIAGALIAPFVLLPLLGLKAAVLACAAVNAALAVAFVLRSAAPLRARRLRAGGTVGLVALTAWAAGSIATEHGGDGRVLFVEHGRQASVAVLRVGGRRDLIVDGDPEASTAGSPRRTEELLAVVPLLLNPAAQRMLEVGLGSGITLATAALFPLERIDCVEISGAVLNAAPYFAPDNGAVASGSDSRIRLAKGDGRAYLARHPGEYDVIVANTAQPWSVGATGLYSREYFARVAAALRPGGIAVQWLPVERLGAEHLAAILRTFFDVFEEGGLWWGADNLIAVGARAPFDLDGAAPLLPRTAAVTTLLERVGIRNADDLRGRRLAHAEAIRETLGPGPIISDDRPVLEAIGALRQSGPGGERALVEQIARFGARSNSSSGPLLLWLQSRVARETGADAAADTLTRLAEEAGLALARSERISRRVAQAIEDFSAGRTTVAEEELRRAVAEDPHQRDARFALAALALETGNPAVARVELTQLLAAYPADAESWNLLGVALGRDGEPAAARRAFERALAADPFLSQALANAGLLAAEAGEPDVARGFLKQLRAISPLGPTPEEGALRAALEPSGGD